MFVWEARVTTLCACAFEKFNPSAAIRSRNGVFTREFPAKPTESARSVSMVMRMMSFDFGGVTRTDSLLHATTSSAAIRKFGLIKKCPLANQRAFCNTNERKTQKLNRAPKRQTRGD